ncbi:hypothetical protein [Bacillus sp. T33-2]|uniref:hypothetical protein n=1 Tax=Bacillus sp. T33-2 TaxID=2054168 RepID=UPI000C7706B3|nr:hypothetical protein [Bacillus sp. T33-2]PLR92661.1 hypothetical protein CVD19_20615 [Bacillus sp. T33-2]
MGVIIEYSEYAVAMLMVAQIVYGFTLLVFGESMMSWFAWGYYDRPESWTQKTQNIWMNLMIGSGYHIYKRLLKYSWAVRKVLLLIMLLLLSILFIIVFNIIFGLLRWLLL